MLIQTELIMVEASKLTEEIQKDKERKDEDLESIIGTNRDDNEDSKISGSKVQEQKSIG